MMNTPITINGLMLIIGLSVNIIAFIGSLVMIWINIRVRIAKIETTQTLEIANMKRETDLKLKQIESKTTGLVDFMAQRLAEFVEGNKDEHREIKDLVSKVFDKIDALKDKQK